MNWLTITLLLLVSTPCYTQVVQDFELTNVADGNTVSLKNYSSNPGVVIIMSSIKCPYTDYYLDRIKTLAESYKGKVPVLLINSSKEENESVTEMTDHVRMNKLTMPYLVDKEQKVLNNLNPRKNPEVFLLQNVSGKFKIIYRGAIDDNPQSAQEITHAYLREAIDALLATQKIVTSDVRPVGCSIKKD